MIQKYSRNADYIVPVPLHQSRLRKRGFNQSAIIGQAISEVTGTPLLSNLLKRSKKTKTQTTKNRLSRIENLNNAFEAHPKYTDSEIHVLLIDDVITTGATLESCAIALRNIGINKISMATLAMGQN